MASAFGISPTFKRNQRVAYTGPRFWKVMSQTHRPTTSNLRLIVARKRFIKTSCFTTDITADNDSKGTLITCRRLIEVSERVIICVAAMLITFRIVRNYSQSFIETYKRFVEAPQFVEAISASRKSFRMIGMLHQRAIVTRNGFMESLQVLKRATDVVKCVEMIWIDQNRGIIAFERFV